MGGSGSLLQIRNLTIDTVQAGERVHLVENVSLDVDHDEVVSIVGESGSGKSLTLLAVMGLLPPGVRVTSGSIIFDGYEMTTMELRDFRKIRGNTLGMVFQDPMTSLNPVLKVGRQVGEAVRLHRPGLSRQAVKERAVELLSAVRIPDPAARYDTFPHQMSGGMRQRVMIAMAMANDPKLLLADEPTTALDVTIQSHILRLLKDVRRKAQASMILVTHDLGIVAENADRVIVMYSGRVVESGDTESIFRNPRHPYTSGLLASALDLGSKRGSAYAIPGQPVSALRRPSGCPFHPRCSRRESRANCVELEPILAGVGYRHEVACWYPEESFEWESEDDVGADRT